MKILLLSAYDSLSHRRWREGLTLAFPEHAWTTLTLPPRHFSWRIRGNSLTWAFSQREILSRPYDLAVATSMTDLAALRGLVPSLTQIPTLLYCHENQFAYPRRAAAHGSVEPQIVTLYAGLAADWVVFNSEYNRHTFLRGAHRLLTQMPDAVPNGVADHIAARSVVVPVPIEDVFFSHQRRGTGGQPITLLWNHRWEYDKAPERFLRALVQLRDTGVRFHVHVVGQQFRKSPSAFEEMRQLFPEHIGAWGMVDEVRYLQVLRESQVVVSSALHDFQGLAVLEAVAAGCIPAVPDRLAYRDFIEAAFRFPSLPDDPTREADTLARRLAELAQSHALGTLPTAPDVSRLRWEALKPAYGAAFTQTRAAFEARH